MASRSQVWSKGGFPMELARMTERTTTDLRAVSKELHEQLRHAAYFPDRMRARAGLLEELRRVEDRLRTTAEHAVGSS